MADVAKVCLSMSSQIIYELSVFERKPEDGSN